jgi:hypothetical protein
MASESVVRFGLVLLASSVFLVPVPQLIQKRASSFSCWPQLEQNNFDSNEEYDKLLN